MSRKREVPTGNKWLPVELLLLGVQPPTPERRNRSSQHAQRDESLEPLLEHDAEVTLLQPARMMEWETWWPQTPLLERACGFESRSGHSELRPDDVVEDLDTRSASDRHRVIAVVPCLDADARTRIYEQASDTG